MCLTNSFYAICYSVLESCVYWTAETLDATVEYGIVFFNDIIKYQASSSEFPQNVNIYIRCLCYCKFCFDRVIGESLCGVHRLLN